MLNHLTPKQQKFMDLTKKYITSPTYAVTHNKIVGISQYALFIVASTISATDCGNYDENWQRVDYRIPDWKYALGKVPLHSFTTPYELVNPEFIKGRVAKHNARLADPVSLYLDRNGYAHFDKCFSSYQTIFDRNLIAPALGLMKQPIVHHPYALNLPVYFSCPVTGLTLYANSLENNKSYYDLPKDLMIYPHYARDFSLQEYTYLFATLNPTENDFDELEIC